MSRGVRCYGLRRLQPFLGVVQIIESADARALSIDGIDWEVQALGERPEHGWRSGNTGVPVRQFFRFGHWDPHGGLSRVPLNPLLDIGSMLDAVEVLIAELPGHTAHLPFPLADHHEHWLLDDAAQPIAVVDAAPVEGRTRTQAAEPWRAVPSSGVDFPARSLESAQESRRHLDHLETLVGARCAGVAQACWFTRLPDGQGRDPAGRTFQADRFPILGLTEDWDAAVDQALVREYLDWMAPLLLMLPMPAALRERLEQAARQRARLVDRYHRLYPDVIDTGLIETARVEARLRSARQPT